MAEVLATTHQIGHSTLHGIVERGNSFRNNQG